VKRSQADVPLRDSLRPPGPVRFSLSARKLPGAVILHVDGEVDILTAPRLAAQLALVIRRRAGDVIVDLRAATFIDSAGLHALLSARRRLIRASRTLTVVCEEEGHVRHVIELARLTETLGVVASLRDAQANLGVPSPTPLRARG
jgi:anti-sigma B factor antagonist